MPRSRRVSKAETLRYPLRGRKVIRGAQKTMARIVAAIRIKRESWDRFRLLRGLYGFAVFLTSLFAVARWWFWWIDETKLYVPVLWTCAIILLIAAGPKGRRRVVLLGVLGLYVFYGVKGLLLDHIPQAALLIIASVIVFILVALTSPPGYYD